MLLHLQAITHFVSACIILFKEAYFPQIGVVLPSRLLTLSPKGAEHEFCLTHYGIALFWPVRERSFAKGLYF